MAARPTIRISPLSASASAQFCYATEILGNALVHCQEAEPNQKAAEKAIAEADAIESSPA